MKKRIKKKKVLEITMSTNSPKSVVDCKCILLKTSLTSKEATLVLELATKLIIYFEII